jgi:protein-disulfide isomerase
VRSWTIVLAGAVCGAMMGVAIIFAAANHGLLPHNEGGSNIRSYLLTHPELVSQMTDLLQAKQQAETDRANSVALKKIGMAAFFDPKLAFVTGPADAKKSLVEFYDYDCPYCRASLPAMIRFYEAHKNDTRFSFIELPIAQLHGSSAVLAARASLAARLQPDKYISFHFALMSEQGAVDENVIFADAQKAGVNVAKLKADMQSPEIDKVIDLSQALAQKAGIDGTPTFIANGVMHPGAVDDQTLSDMAKTG